MPVPEKRRRLRDANEYRQFQIWLNHLAHLLIMEFTPAEGEEGLLLCSSCKTAVALANPEIAKYHHPDCLWLATWLSVPQPYRDECELGFELAPDELLGLRNST